MTLPKINTMKCVAKINTSSKNTILGICILTLISCTSAVKNQAKAEITTTMAQQELAWNRGNLNDFMLPYLQSDTLVFVGSRGITYGWHNTLDNYKKSYPDTKAMGILKFNNLHISPLGSNHYSVIGQWKLFRISDTLQGHYSLIWKNINNKWVIIADHSS